MQNQRPIAFQRQFLKGKALLLSTYEELLALVTAMHKWRPYLLGRPFIIKIDQQGLNYILEQRIATPPQQKWLTKLLGYLFVVEYKQGCENKVADALSRRSDSASTDQTTVSPVTPSSLCLISFPCPSWIYELKASYQSDSIVQSLLQQLQDGSDMPKFFSLHNGLILYKGRVYMSPSCGLKLKVLQQVHDSPLGGHSGFLKSYHRLKQDFYWVGMRANLKNHITKCGMCQQMKHETCHPVGLLQPLPIPDKPWTTMSMDFVVGLPKSQRMNVVVVGVDRLTKYVHFMGLSHPYSTAKTTALFAQHVFKLHGIPNSIVSDRDPIFTAKFWAELFKLQGVQLAMSSVYHPQSNGQIEVVNKSLEHYLRSFFANNPTKWAKWLYLLSFGSTLTIILLPR